MTPQEQRELIEDCAKALQSLGDPNFCNYEVMDNTVGLELGSRPGAITAYWNPLTSAADCEMLECGLEIDVRWWGKFVSATLPGLGGEFYENFTDADKPQAKRLAVCRAAQEYQRRKG